MIRKLKCFFGWHEIREEIVIDHPTIHHTEFFCKHCRLTQEEIDDLECMTPHQQVKFLHTHKSLLAINKGRNL